MMPKLRFQQLVNVPTHRRGHTLDWLITNRVVDVEELCVVDQLISDHFVISFTLHFRKPGKTTKEVRSRNVRALDTENFKTDVLSAFPAVSGAADRASAYNACLRELLDKHAPPFHAAGDRPYVHALDDPGNKAGQATTSMCLRQPVWPSGKAAGW